MDVVYIYVNKKVDRFLSAFLSRIKKKMGNYMSIYGKNIELLKEYTLEEEKRYEELDKIQGTDEHVFEEDGILFYTDGKNT